MFTNKKLFEEVNKLKLIKKQHDEIKKFKDKVKNKEYHFENINCQICTSPQESIILSKLERLQFEAMKNNRKLKLDSNNEAIDTPRAFECILTPRSKLKRIMEPIVPLQSFQKDLLFQGSLGSMQPSLDDDVPFWK